MALKLESIEIVEFEEPRKIIRKRYEQSVRDLRGNIKRINMCVCGVPEGQERKKGAAKTLENNIRYTWQKINLQSKKTATPYQDKHTQNLGTAQSNC